MLILAKECFELDTEYIENDLNGCWSMNNVKTNTAEQCQDLCVKTEGCHGFSWKSPNFSFYEPRLKLECCLKNGIAANNTKAYDGIVSGPKICGNINLDLIHNSLMMRFFKILLNQHL